MHLKNIKITGVTHDKVIYDRHIFIVQAAECHPTYLLTPPPS